MESSAKKLYRSRSDKIVAGVCGGLGEYFRVDSILVRAAFIAMLLYGGFGLLLYIILAIIIPEEPGETVAVDRKEKLKEFTSEMGERAQNLAADIKHDDRFFENRRNILAIFIIAIGVFALANQILPFTWLTQRTIAAAVLIIIGVVILLKRENRQS